MGKILADPLFINSFSSSQTQSISTPVFNSANLFPIIEEPDNTVDFNLDITSPLTMATKYKSVFNASGYVLGIVNGPMFSQHNKKLYALGTGNGQANSAIFLMSDDFSNFINLNLNIGAAGSFIVSDSYYYVANGGTLYQINKINNNTLTLTPYGASALYPMFFVINDNLFFMVSWNGGGLGMLTGSGDITIISNIPYASIIGGGVIRNNFFIVYSVNGVYYVDLFNGSNGGLLSHTSINSSTNNFNNLYAVTDGVYIYIFGWTTANTDTGLYWTYSNGSLIKFYNNVPWPSLPAPMFSSNYLEYLTLFYNNNNFVGSFRGGNLQAIDHKGGVNVANLTPNGYRHSRLTRYQRG